MNMKKMGGTLLKGLKKAHKAATSEKTKSAVKKIQARGAHMQNMASGVKTRSTKSTAKRPVKKIVKRVTKKKTVTKPTTGYKKMGTYASKVRADKEAKFYKTEGARVKITKYGGKYGVYVALHE